MKRTGLLTGLLLLVMLQLAAGRVEYTLSFEPPVLSVKNGVTEIYLQDSQIYGQPGAPALPYRGVKLLLPTGEEAVSLQVEPLGTSTSLGQAVIQPIGQYLPLSKMDRVMSVLAPNPAIYNADAPYPPSADNGIMTHFMNGYPIAFTAVTPFTYNPVTHDLNFTSQFRIIIETTATQRSQAATALLKRDAWTLERVGRAVLNQFDLPREEDRPEGSYEYVMIVDEAKITQWTPLKDLYESRGTSVLMQTVQNIISNTAGTDVQMKVRNFLIATYASNPVRYVLLGGDTELIPHRGMYVSVQDGDDYTDNDIPADMYYACLDGNWNADGDSYWGEMMEADLVPEFAIGRICYNNNTEIANQINKIMMYETMPVESEVKTALFVGEWLWDGPTWGGDYMDEMIGGCSTHGYTTVGVPLTWNIATLYDRTFGAADSWDAADIRPLLSQGKNMINHLGHSNTTYNMRLNSNQVTATSITNNGVNHNFSNIFTQGCYAGAFDNRGTTAGSYGADCITEKFTSITTAAVTMVAHSRYGWGQQGSTDGPSQYYHRQYVDAFFGENIFEVGSALVDAKLDCIPFMTNQPVMYWVAYETNLIGDPALQMWTDTPQAITVQMQNPWLAGQGSYQVVTNAPNANLRIFDNGVKCYEGTTNSAGIANIALLEALEPGSYDLYINAHNFYAYQITFQVQASNMPYVICNNISAVDADNLLQTGDQFSLRFTLKNIGLVNQSQSGTLTVASNSPYLSVVNGTHGFNPLNAADSLEVNGWFILQVGNGFSDLTQAVITINASFDGHTSQSTGAVVLNAPVLSVVNYQIDNNGNYILPGDSPAFYLTVSNTGSGSADDVIVVWLNTNQWLTLNTDETAISHIAPGAQVLATQPIVVTLSPETPNGNYSISYFMGAANGNVVDGSISFYVGQINYTFEQGMENWVHLNYNPTYTDQWNRNSSRHYNGSWSMKFGGTGTSNYSNLANGYLISPQIILGANAQLKFYDWMEAEISTGQLGHAWDGGRVQMSIDGTNWFQITPTGGYPYLCVNNVQSPFPAETPLFSGTHDWQEEVFDLSAYTGSAQFRFEFGSDGNVNDEGWYVDDIRVEMEYTDAQDGTVPVTVRLFDNYPNPFNPETSIRFSLPIRQQATLCIYNQKGQLVKTLLNNGKLDAGEHSYVWNGLDDRRQPVASGVYLYRLSTGKLTQTRKMMLIK